MPPPPRLPLIVGLLLLCVISCNSKSEQEQLHDDLTGHWLVLYADHKLTNDKQREMYGRMQDSIISMRGLKLISFYKDGSFQQLDSIDKKGKWGVSGKDIYITDAGEGFHDFKTEFFDLKDSTLRTVEYISKDDESIKLVWHMKKADGSDLFKPEKNTWRKKPGKPETDKEIKARLTDILQYYSDYYKLVSKESSYFIPSRVALPFQFYQHAMGLKPFTPGSSFTRLFYDSTQAVKAYQYLDSIFYKMAEAFPRRENYVDEYAVYMEMLAEAMRKSD
jgi:hypothetical protein